MSSKISTLNEKSLHAALKTWYARPNDQLEVAVDGFVIDIVRDEHLIEIQTRNFSSIKRKLIQLTQSYPVRLIYPIAKDKWIVKLLEDGTFSKRRKSPKHGGFMHVFDELVSFPQLLVCHNFTLDVLLIQEEEVRHYVGRRAWRRRGWATYERRLLKVVGQQTFESPDDMLTLLPTSLDEPFTTADLAKAVMQSRRLAGKMAYCLREMGAIQHVGKQGNAFLYRRNVDHE